MNIKAGYKFFITVDGGEREWMIEKNGLEVAKGKALWQGKYTPEMINVLIAEYEAELRNEKLRILGI